MSARFDRSLETAVWGLLFAMVLWLVGSCIVDHRLGREWPVDYAAVQR